MKSMNSELGQCLIFAVLFIFIVNGFNQVLWVITGG